MIVQCMALSTTRADRNRNRVDNLNAVTGTATKNREPVRRRKLPPRLCHSTADGTKPNIETYKCHNRCNACNSHFFGQQKPNDLLHFDLEHRVKLVRQGDGLMRHKALVPRLFEAWLKGAFQNSSRIQNDPGHHHLV